MRAIETVVIGAGQAGLALSRRLSAAGRAHVLLERGRVGERWRSERWDSLRLLTPNRLNRLPGAPEPADPGGYLDRRGVIAQLEAYAAGAPVCERTTVVGVRRAGGAYAVATDRGAWLAHNVVIATGDCDVPRLPAAAADVPAGVHDLHSSAYRRPGQLPPGGVLVVGAGPTGQQLALELRRSGRPVALAVGRHARMPRRYRGRDVFEWLADSGQLGVRASEVADLAAARAAPSFPVSGAGGGSSLGLDLLASEGVTVCGRLEGFSGRRARFAGDLRERIDDAERRLRRTLAGIDAHVAATGAPAGPPDAPPPVAVDAGPAALALGGRLRTVLWATGFRRAYPWLHVPVLDADGELIHREGVTPAPGLFALGLRFQRTRGSHLIGGVGADAEWLAAVIEARSGAELAQAA